MERFCILVTCTNAVLLLLILNYNISYISAQSNCKEYDSCQKCIQHAKSECTWCATKNYTSRGQVLPRCNLFEKHEEDGCANIINPKSSVMPTKNDDLTNTTKVKPQEVTLALRPGQTKTFNISVRTPENYPVDVYMLMDMSYSMRDNLQSVERLGNDLAVKMAEITSRFRVGFGSMVDKPLSPFAETDKSFWETKSAQTFHGRHVSPPWIFHNVLPLTDNASLFEASVKSEDLSENIDSPDGWLDALMQVAVCDAVGWVPKDQARRLVVVSTEAEFHIAGDGLLAGLVTPNDGLCKLDNSNTYMGKETDYPSLAYLRHILAEQSIVPIFAVPPTSYKLYEIVDKYFKIGVGASVGKLENNSTNIVRLIRQTYDKIGKIQSIYHNADDTKGIKVKLFAHCSESGGRVEKPTCSNVNIGETVTFEVAVTLENCPENAEYAEFNITTTLGDTIPIKIKYLCDCNCTKKTVYNSSDCSGNGQFECGKCICNPGYSRETCDCADANIQENRDKCIAPNATTVCSGETRGECKCGKCICINSELGEGRIDGEFCQCNSLDCPRDKNEQQICGGSDRGTCECNKCKCKPGWTGPSCSCSNKTSDCYQNNVECSNHGRCECNQCVCDDKYTGKYCETCDGCGKECGYYEDCVRCQIYSTGPLVGDCQGGRCNATITVVNDVDSHASKGKTCLARDEDDCTFSFILAQNDDKVEIFAEEEKACPREEGYLLIIIGVILGIVAIGAALLLIWKLLATIQDRREFAKFEREQQNARWDTSENPIFKQATTTFQNPTYGKS